MSLPDLAACTRVVNVISAASSTAAVTTTTGVDTQGYYEALLIVNTGAMASGATLDCKITSCATSGGTYADVTGAAIGQMADTEDDSQVAGRLLCNGQDRFLKVVLTCATAASLRSATLVLIPYDTGNSNNTTMDFAV